MSELQHTVRALLRTPGYTLIVVLTLAIGIGAATAIFSVLNAVLLRPLPFREADRLVYVGVLNPKFTDAIKVGITAFAPSHADVADLRREVRSLSSLTVFAQGNLTMTDQGAAQSVGGASVSGEFFQTLGVGAALGRAILPEDASAVSERVAVISDRLWHSRFEGSPKVIGEMIRLNREPYRIVGVMPSRFRYPDVTDVVADASVPTDIWLGLRLTAAQRAERDFSDTSGAVGRLAPGVSVEQARAEIARVISTVDGLKSAEWRGWYAVVNRLAGSDIREVRQPLWLLFGGVALLLVVACSNTAHLFLARTLGRAGELSVRAALGAGRGRLVRSLMTEAMLLAMTGGLLGLATAFGLIRLLPLLNPGGIARMDETSLDARVYGFSVGLSLLTVVLVGLFPALSLSRRAAGSLNRPSSGARTTIASRRVRRALIVAQIGLAVVLLTSATLLVRSYINVQKLDRGLSTSTLTMRLAIGEGYREPAKRTPFYQNLLAAVRSVPGVMFAGGVNTIPLNNSGSISRFDLEGYPNRPDQMVHSRSVTGGYIEAMDTRVIKGRLVTDADARPESPQPVVLVNQTFERTFFHGDSAIGKRIRFGDTRSTVVGVIADMRHDTLEAPPEPQVYQASIFQGNDQFDGLSLAVRSQARRAGTVADVRAAIQRVDPDIMIEDVRLMGERVSHATALRRFQMSLLAAFAGVAVLLAAIGLYGLMAYTVRQRTMEIGIRLSLGAQLRDILRLVFGEGLRLTVVGLACGLTGAVLVTRLLGSMLYGVTATDPSAFVVVSLVLLFVGGLACWIPARRAARVDPIIALRSE